MIRIPEIETDDFRYPLPENRIAQTPIPERDQSKLLIFRNGKTGQDVFFNLANHLPRNTHMIFNETRVIQARIVFKKPGGTRIEIFCLEPIFPTHEVQQAFGCHSGVTWKCLVGNSKRWKSGLLIKEFLAGEQTILLRARRMERLGETSLIEFTWESPEVSFSEILLHAGLVPLPPYVTREPTEEDVTRYQTVYARQEGSVAAPTAGLHFTDRVFANLTDSGITFDNVILHVGAGTFKPLGQNVRGHEMHAEQVLVTKSTIGRLVDKLHKPILVTGTTTLRTLESLYWHGVKILSGKTEGSYINIGQWEPYDDAVNSKIPANQALTAILQSMNGNDQETLSGQTRLMILPGYPFKIADMLITNFHMPGSTLLLLVSAFIGNDWRKAYQFALDHDFRFLSYGDSCLLIRPNGKVHE